MRRRHTTLIAAALAGCSLSGYGIASGYASASFAGKPVSAPLVERHYGFGVAVFVRLTLAGHPYFFMIDTGASATVVEPQVAESVGLRENGSPREVAPLGCRGSARTMAMRGWRLGRTRLPGGTVFSFRLLIPRAFPRPFAGLLSPVLLSRFGSVTIDYSNSRLLLGAGRPVGGDTVHLKIYRRAGMQVTTAVRFDGRRSQFLVDTGATFSAIDSTRATQLELPAVGHSVAIDGAACRTSATPVAVRDWSVAGVSHPHAVILRIRSLLPKSYRDAGISGIVGSATLSHRGTLTIDYTHSTMNLGGTPPLTSLRHHGIG